MIRLIGYFFGIGAFLLLGTAAAVAIYLGAITKDLPITRFWPIMLRR